MIAMISYPKMAFDHLDDSLGGPKFCPVPVGHSPFGQETNQLLFLLGRQPGGPTRGGLGLQGVLPAGSQHIPPTENTAGVAPDASSDFMKGELLFEEGNHSVSSFFQGLWRTLGSHGDPSF